MLMSVLQTFFLVLSPQVFGAVLSRRLSSFYSLDLIFVLAETEKCPF